MGNLTTLTLPDNTQLSYTYDAAHRVTGVKNSANETIAYTYDANDDITQQQVSGTSIAKTQSAVFDSLGRLLKQIGAAGQTTAFAYDANGNRIGTTDALNNTTSQSFDPLNRLVGSIDPLHSTTAYAYDVQDDLTSVKDPKSIVTTYTYDGFGQVLSEASPDSGTTAYVLDAVGNRIRQTDARGIVTNRTFDKLNRVLTETYPASRSENVTYRYDQGRFGIGRLSSISDESGSTAFTYNARGDVLTDTRTIRGRAYRTTYYYDLADHVTDITYPDGRTTVSYTRDSAGRVSGISSGRRAIISSVTYKPFGPVSGFAFGNGIKTQYTYDMDYRLTSILAKGRETVQNLAMAYDPAGDITSIINAGDGDNDHDDHKAANLNQTFTYDEDYRLLSASGIYGTQAYTYDADGNRVVETDTIPAKHGTTTNVKSYTYAAGSNRLVAVNDNGKSSAFTYDAAGNLLTAPGQSFAYNARNRNSGLATQGHDHWDWGHLDRDHDDHFDHDGRGGASYLYNALGERVSKDVNGRDRLFNSSGDAQFLYDQQGNLIAETDGWGRVTKQYVYLNGLPVAQIDGDGDNIRYIHTDHLGTPQKMTNAGQQIVWSRTADPFGQTVDVKGLNALNLRFPGQYHDAESGLDYNLFRSYNAGTGRYTQADPIGLKGGINRFSYVGGNPVNRIDHNGELWAQVIGVSLVTVIIAEQFWEQYTELSHLHLTSQPPVPAGTTNSGVCTASPNNQFSWDTQKWKNASPQQFTQEPDVPESLKPPAIESPEWPESTLE